MFAYGDGLRNTASFRQHPLYIGAQVAGIDSGAPPNGYTLTFSVAQLAFLVFNTTEPGHAFQLAGHWGRAIHQIWPPKGASITWAPQPALSHEQFIAFADFIGS